MKRIKTVIGWREWVSLPDLGVAWIKAKVDTGARTSALHAFCVEPYRDGGLLKVRFGIHPFQRRDDLATECTAEVADRRWVTDSGGHRERRYIIVTEVSLGERTWPIEITLTNRDIMQFRMLLGRTAIKKGFVVDPGRSYRMGRGPRSG